MRDVIRLFEKFLETRSLRLTRQRGEILRAMYATHKHISADDLYDLLRKHDQQGKLKISRATVYRTLSLLSEGGFIQALDLGTEQGTLYEHVLGHDHHDLAQVRTGQEGVEGGDCEGRSTEEPDAKPSIQRLGRECRPWIERHPSSSASGPSSGTACA